MKLHLKMRKYAPIILGIALFSVVLAGLGIVGLWSLHRGAGQPLPVADRSVVNKYGYPVYMIEGTVEKIYGVAPLRFEVLVRASRIMPAAGASPLPDQISMVTAAKDTELIFRDLKSGQESVLRPETLQVGDDVVVWTVEPNTETGIILKSEAFTAAKIIKNR